MTLEEAIEELNHELLILECLIEEVNSFICDCDVDDDEYDDEKEQCEISLTRYKKEKEVIEMAISALKEIQQYREIGTVEECREAVERQKVRKPVLRNDNGKLRKSCPVCGCFFSPLSRNCPKCGQAIEREENSEGMEE